MPFEPAARTGELPQRPVCQRLCLREILMCVQVSGRGEDVVVQEEQAAAPGRGGPGVAGGGPPALRALHHPGRGPGRLPRQAVQQLPRPVGGAVVDDHHLVRAPVPLCGQGDEGGPERRRLAPGGDHHAQHGTTPAGRARASDTRGRPAAR